MNEIDQLQQRLKQFALDRDWEQFHAPNKLAMALIVEAAELVEHFQWLTEQQSKQLDEDKRQQVAFELADVFIYSLRLAERLDIDLLDAVEKKIVKSIHWTTINDWLKHSDIKPHKWEYWLNSNDPDFKKK